MSILLLEHLGEVYLLRHLEGKFVLCSFWRRVLLLLLLLRVLLMFVSQCCLHNKSFILLGCPHGIVSTCYKVISPFKCFANAFDDSGPHFVVIGLDWRVRCYFIEVYQGLVAAVLEEVGQNLPFH